jgi:hypothetical protein
MQSPHPEHQKAPIERNVWTMDGFRDVQIIQTALRAWSADALTSSAFMVAASALSICFVILMHG